MSVNHAIRRRALGLSHKVDIDFAVDQIRLKEVLTLPNSIRDQQDDLNDKTYGPLASAKLKDDIYAVANEDGHINLIRTNKLENLTHWLAHDNAIFDLKACPDQKTIISASGDTTIRKWDVETKREVSNIQPHHSSIKSISIYSDSVIASGSRDGSIKIHDLRQKNPTMATIRDAHRNMVLSKSRKSTRKTDPISCVTNVTFDPCYPRLYSTGANDATIKLWDLRGKSVQSRLKRTTDGQILLSQPYLEVRHPVEGVHVGYCHLLLSSGKVYAACSDNKIYCYENFGSKAEPIKFTGYRYDTYLRLAIMDDRFLLSGGKGSGALVWSLTNKKSSMYYPVTTKQPIGQLKPDMTDRFDTNVIETDWDSLSITSFRDDGLVSKWTMHHVRETERKQLLNEQALVSVNNDVTIQMSDIIGVDVLRPNYRSMNASQVS